MAQVTQASIQPSDPPVRSADGAGAAGTGTADPVLERTPRGPIERLMSTVIRRLAWSRLSDPKVALVVSGLGLLLGLLVGATAPNTETLPLRLPLSHLLPSLIHEPVLASAMLYSGDLLACLGLAGMLWAHSQGWRPDPRYLLLASGVIVAIMVSLTPVGSSDTASYAAYGRIAALGGNPYTTTPLAGVHSAAYLSAIGSIWKTQVSVYGPIATAVQWVAASIGGANVVTTVWILMILNGAVFLGVGILLWKTSDDPVRATLFWTANPVILQQLVGGGHLDTLVAGAAICAIQVARKTSGLWGDIAVGVLVGVASGIKITGVLIGLGLAWPLLRRREWLRTARIAAVALVVLGAVYLPYGVNALKPLVAGSKLVTLPSPWWFVLEIGKAVGQQSAATLIISCLWPVAMLAVAWVIYRRISSDQPSEVVAPFALAFAWVIVAPWVFPWYTALAWVALTQVPRNRMSRWITIVTVVLALWHSSGGQASAGHPVALRPAASQAAATSWAQARRMVAPLK
jgi:hypothetical protein